MKAVKSYCQNLQVVAWYLVENQGIFLYLFSKTAKKEIMDSKNVDECAFAGFRLGLTRGRLEMYGTVEKAGELQKMSFNKHLDALHRLS